ncbi:MAG: two pore domain potassium channel family protein [Bacteroidales bacterium]|nr:two pore domain potassium channel family protein [Bacteroidales bacterium]
MIKDFYSYKIKVKDAPFKAENGKEYENTATISFLDESKKEITYIELGYIDKEHIYKLIDKEQAINLDNCYVENFSLIDYKESRNIEKKALVKIHQFSAFNTFFDSRIATDFSFAEFDDEYKNFENAHFLNGAVNFNSSQFNNGGINFSYVFFNDGNTDFSNVNFGNGEVNFKNSYFGTGHKNFQYAHFGEGNVLFVNTEFNKGNVTFINSEFKSNRVSFKVARFEDGKIDFHFARFHCKELIFERTEFGNGRIDFRTTEFANAKVSFNRSIFGNGEKTFEACQHLAGKITFRRTIWGDGNLSFEQAELDNTLLFLDNANFGKGNLSFNNSHIKQLSLKSCHLDYYADLRVSKCEHIDLSDTIARDIIDIKPYDFDLDIKTINFSGMRLIGRIYIDWYINDVKKLIYSQNSPSKRDYAEQFRILKENFNNTGQYTDEDKAYVEFKRNELDADLQDAIHDKPISRLWKYPSYAFQWLVFDKIGLYATNPLRVLTSMVFGYIFFSLLYLILPFFIDTKIVSSLGDPDKLGKVAVSFYHSAITFLTIGYGDYYPSGAFRWLSGLEGFVGLFLMSYFTVAFVRKILR